MREAAGVLALIIGVGGLGWYGATNPARDMEADISQRAAAVPQINSAVHGISTKVSGRDITVSGVANDESEKTAILAALNDVNGRRVVHDDLSVLQTASPYSFRGTKTEAGLTYEGNAPNESVKTEIAAALGIENPDSIEIAAGAPDGFMDAVNRGPLALAPLIDGMFEITDQSVHLSGTAQGPTERDAARAAVEGLPDGFTMSDEITLLDDGSPFTLNIDRNGTDVIGKVPSGFDLGTLAAIDGSGATQGVAQSPVEDADWAQLASVSAIALSALQDGALQIEDRSVTLTGTGTRAQLEAAQAALADLQSGVETELDLTIIDDGQPSSLMVKTTADTATVSGKLPFGFDDSNLTVGDLEIVLSDDLARGEIEDTANFADATQIGLTALSQLDSGTLIVDEDAISLAGIAATPAEMDAALAALQDTDRSVTTDISTVSDGIPLALNVEYEAGASASVRGKLPSGLAIADIAAALDVPQADGDPVQAIQADTTFDAATQAGLSALAQLETGSLSVDEARIVLTGAAATPAERDEALRLLEQADLDTDVEISTLGDGIPLSVNIEYQADTSATVTGKLPAGLEMADVAATLSLEQINGEPAQAAQSDAAFDAATQAGLTALAQLNTGSLSVDADKITLTGAAATPAEKDAAISELTKAGLPVETDIETLGDGIPLAFTVDYDAKSGAVVTGKLPADITVANIANALSLPEPKVTGTPSQADDGEITDLISKLSAIGGWLPEAETMSIKATETSFEVTGELSPGVDVALTTDEIANSDAAPDTVTLSGLSVFPDQSDSRVNAAKGQREIFIDGFWQPMVNFTATKETCDTQVAQVFETNSINFLTGSFVLDARSVRAVESMAAVLNRCIQEAELRVEIGGHTDSQGDDAGNLNLSQRRAEAVAIELIRRGVSSGALDAIGFGESQPIADNETQNGRAQNRRTSVTFK